MANFAYTATKSFTPFTFEQMLKPMAMYTEEYNAIQDSLGELATKADMFSKLATDPETQAMYKKYSNDLAAQAESLAKQGLTPASRQGLINMKKRYASEITPIEQAYTKREELVKEQRKLKAANPSIMFDTDFSTVSLNDIINNPAISYSSVSGDDLYKKGKEAAIASSARVMDVIPALRDQYWKIRQGYGAEAANEFLLNQESIPELKQAIDRIVSQSGVSKNNLSRAIDYTISGVMSGLSYDEKYQANRGYQDELEKERLQLQKDQFEWTKKQKEEETKGIELPNGNRLKLVGAGRAIEINEKDGTWKFVSSPSTTASGVSGRTAEKQALFTTLEYTGDSFGTPDSTDKFSIEDSEQITFSDLSPKARKKLQEDLKEYGLSIEDIDIYKDQDYLSRNHYRIVRKGYGAEGITLQQQEEEGL
jgi:hypothetical protein